MKCAILLAVNQTRTTTNKDKTMNLETAKKLITNASCSEEGYVAVLNEGTKRIFFMKGETLNIYPHCGSASSINPKKMFATEDECRRAVEESIERYNSDMNEYNDLMRAKGLPEVKLKKMDDYLVKIIKLRYVRKLEVIEE